MRITLYDYCWTHDRPELLREWHPAKNAPLTPEGITYGSKRSVWWKCEKGHEWQAAVYTRAAGSGCPYCAGKRAWPGENDLASQRPDLAAQWHPTKNNGVTPADIPLGSHHMAWWVCEKGHEWKAIVKSRAIGGTGCPVCANRVLVPGENDLVTTHPDLARQWHPSRNGALTPQAVTAGAQRKVWWLCGKGHAWQASIASRAAAGVGCPVCAGRLAIPGVNDFASARPELAAEWHPTKNGALTPEMVTPLSNKKVWWRCPKGHAYQAVVGTRTMRKTGCPYCANKKVLPGFNDLATTHPELAGEWHPEKNSRKATEVTAGSHAKAWWLCPRGHTYEAVISSRTLQHTGCPVCANRVILPEENSLAALFPMIAAEWHPKKNGKRRPETLSAGTDLRVWWRCSKGHEWTAKISDRTQKNSGCPYCMNRRVLAGFNDLATTHPKIAAQWHPALNGKLTPEMFTYGSAQRVWWLCEEGHVWKAPISRRAGVQKSGCPVCSGRVSIAKRRYYDGILKEAKLSAKTPSGTAVARAPDLTPNSTGPPGENSG